MRNQWRPPFKLDILRLSGRAQRYGVLAVEVEEQICLLQIQDANLRRTNVEREDRDRDNMGGNVAMAGELYEFKSHDRFIQI